MVAQCFSAFYSIVCKSGWVWLLLGLMTCEGYGDDTECYPCPPGTFASNSREECKPCQHTNGTGGYCTNIDFCTPCIKGMYQNASAQTTCDFCTPGHYCPTAGCTECLECMKGLYERGHGASTCLPCPVGHESLENGSINCTECTAGHYKNSSSQFLCFACPAGYNTSSSGSIECEPCEPGQFASKTGQSECRDCPLGTHCRGKGCSECKDCKPGMFTTSTGSIDCTCCGPGSYKNDSRRTHCHSCASGYYTLDFCQTSCSICPENFYCPCPYCKYECPSNTLCPAGSITPGQCPHLTVITRNDTTGIRGCTWSAQLFIIVIGSVMGFVFLVLSISCVVCRKKVRTGRTDTLRDTDALIKDGTPVYSGL